jgi:hypothetical protein
MSSTCATRFRASARTWEEDTIARGRGLRGDRAGNGGDSFGAPYCPCADEGGSQMYIERWYFGLGLAKPPMRLERGFSSGKGGGMKLSRGSATATIFQWVQLSAFKSALRPSSAIIECT